jgi:propionate catabolism operon transcriptional regulator
MASKKGCKVAIGGNVTMRFAKELGLEFVEIRTSKEDVAATFENAKSVAQSNREQKAVARRYRSIIDAASDGIIATDESGHITTINETAKKLLRMNDNSAVGQPLAHFIPDCPIHQVLLTKKPIYDRLIQINNEQFIFNHLPVMLNNEVIGAVSTFKDTSNVMRAENMVRRALSKGLFAKYKFEEIVHVSPAMRDMVNVGRQFAKTDSTILLTGETGTGKEIFAHGIHNVSRRSRRPFVSINCAALPEQLLESELFGYEEGAFTGSKKGGKPGLFEVAHQGTMFLDEIDSTPPNVQIRLLRVLQEKEVMRIGGDHRIPIDIRVIAAASKDLSLAVRDGQFREDLFFRLNVLRIQIPSLRERREDIPVLLDFFIRLFSDRHGLEPIVLPEDYLQKLMGYAWPGNVRQLRNFSERIVMNCSLRCSPDTLEVLCRELLQYPPRTDTKADETESPLSLKSQLKKQVIQNEREIIREALEKAKFCKTKAAEKLGISRQTLYRKIKEMGLD